jgi:hypothetical protein
MKPLLTNRRTCSSVSYDAVGNGTPIQMSINKILTEANITNCPPSVGDIYLLLINHDKESRLRAFGLPSKYSISTK